MYDQSDSQNKSEEQMDLSEGTSPSGSYDEGSRSTPSNLPKAQTRQRKKKTSDSEDEDFEIEEVSSKKKVLKKEYGDAASTKIGQQKKAPARSEQCLRPGDQLKRLWHLHLSQETMKRARKGSGKQLLECLEVHL